VRRKPAAPKEGRWIEAQRRQHSVISIGEELHPNARSAVPRPDPGRQYRPDEAEIEQNSSTAAAIQVLDLWTWWILKAITVDCRSGRTIRIPVHMNRQTINKLCAQPRDQMLHESGPQRATPRSSNRGSLHKCAEKVRQGTLQRSRGETGFHSKTRADNRSDEGASAPSMGGFHRGTQSRTVSRDRMPQSSHRELARETNTGSGLQPLRPVKVCASLADVGSAHRHEHRFHTVWKKPASRILR